MSKVHYKDVIAQSKVPEYWQSVYARDGLHHSICGYMRKTTSVKSDVTCKLCLRKLEGS